MSRLAIHSLMLLVTLPLLLLGITGCPADEPPTPTQPTVQPPPTGVRAVSLSASPSSLPADGRSSTLIVATCTVGGQQAPNNLPVQFRTDHGDFSLNGVDPISATTPTLTFQTATAGGQAAIFLISETEPAIAIVQAIFGNDAAATTQVRFERKNSDVGTVELTVTPATGSAPLTVQASATVKSLDAKTLSGVQVTFNINDQTAKIDNQRVRTDGSGVASTFIRNISKDATITAKAGGKKAKQLIEIDNEEAKSLTLAALKSDGTSYSEPALVNKEAQLLLRATVTSAAVGGSPVAGALVTFSINDAGAFFTQSQVLTNSNGEAETFVRNIRYDSQITAKSKQANDTFAVKINQPPIAVIRSLSGTPKTDKVSVFVFTADGSYDPDLAFGDTITYSWSFSMITAAVVPVSPTTSSLITVTVTVGSAGAPGIFPAAGDKLVVVLTVTDKNGLSSSSVWRVTF